MLRDATDMQALEQAEVSHPSNMDTVEAIVCMQS